MSWAEDEGYDGWDFDCNPEWEECPDCGELYHTSQPFCYKCLSVEAKWKLGVI